MTANLESPEVSARSNLLAGHRVPVKIEHLVRHGASPPQDFSEQSQSQARTILKPTLPPLRPPPHLERGPHRLLPSWRSPQSQLAHGSLSWPGEGTGDRSRAAAGQRPSLASSPQPHLGHKFSNARCQQVEGCWTGEGKACGDNKFLHSICLPRISCVLSAGSEAKMTPDLSDCLQGLGCRPCPSVGLNFPIWATKLSVVLNQWGGEG